MINKVKNLISWSWELVYMDKEAEIIFINTQIDLIWEIHKKILNKLQGKIGLMEINLIQVFIEIPRKKIINKQTDKTDSMVNLIDLIITFAIIQIIQ